jgi:isopenicillin N synthase-like dioxygenase
MRCSTWAAAHEDLNCFTLLPPSTVPGLEMLTRQGEWVPVIVPPGYLIINTGEQVQHKTAGLIRATRHRVLNPGGQYAKQERLASIFFGSWSSGFSLKPFENVPPK